MQLSRERVAAALASHDRLAVPGTGHRASAVAITLVADPDGVPGLLLTRRSPRLRAHAGQWALPGGRVEPGQGLRETALRELEEELGIALGEDDVVGELDDYVTRSGFRITPVVVWALDRAVEPRPNEAEVASVHHVSLGEVDVDPRFVRIPESDAPVIQVPLLGSLIHAPTGAILHQFREVVLHRRPTRVAHFEQPVFAWR